MELTYEDILYLTLCSQFTFASSYDIEDAADNAWNLVQNDFFNNPKIGKDKLIELNDRLIAALKIMGDSKINKSKEYQC